MSVGKCGGPARYRPHFAAQARERCASGAVDWELAALFEVEERTIRYWKTRYSEFGEAVRGGKAEAARKRRLGDLPPRSRSEKKPRRITSIGNRLVAPQPRHG